MDKNNILQFEPDDASKTGMNGKQVFFTKRINGKVTRNKEIENDSRYISENEVNNDKNNDELFIELKNVKIKPEPNPQSRQNPNRINNNTNLKKNNRNNKRKSIKSRIVSKLIIIIILAVGVGIFAVVSPLFNIEEIKVIGNDKIDTSTIISLSGIINGKNIFQISKNKVINAIKENPYINNVGIKRKLPRTLEINVQERTVAYQIKVINSYVLVDFQGYILEVSSKAAKVPQIEGFKTNQDTLLNGHRLSNEDIESLRTVLRIMETAKNSGVANSISKITITDNEFVLELKKENKIAYLGNATDLTSRMDYIKIIVDSEKGNTGKIFVNGDINNGFKPYFREEKNERSNAK